MIAFRSIIFAESDRVRGKNPGGTSGNVENDVNHSVNDLFGVAELAYEGGDLAKAEELLIHAAKSSDEDAIWANLGMVRLELENFEGAISAYAHMRELRAEDYVNRGLCHDRLGQYPSARSDYEKALELLPGDTDALVNLGTLELQQKNLMRALELLQTVAESDPLANWQLSDVFVETGDLDRAAEVLWIAINAGERRALLDLATVEARRGNEKSAEAVYQRARREGVPGAQEAWEGHADELRIERAIRLRERGAAGEARDMLIPLVERGVFGAAIVLGNVLGDDLGDQAGARDAYQRGIESGDAYSAFNLGLSFCGSGDRIEAERYFSLAREMGDETEPPDLDECGDGGSTHDAHTSRWNKVGLLPARPVLELQTDVTLTPGQQRRLDGVIDGSGWDGRRLDGGRYLRILDPEGLRGISSHVEVALISLSNRTTEELLKEMYPDAGCLLQDTPFTISEGVPVIVLSDRIVAFSADDTAEIVERVVDQRQTVRMKTHPHPRAALASPFDFRRQLNSAHIGPDVPGADYVVRIHQLDVQDDLHEQVLLLLAEDDDDAARIACASTDARHPLAVEVFHPLWSPPVDGMIVFRVARRRRLSMDECISFYHLR